MKFSDLWTERDGESLDLKRVLVIPTATLSPVALQTWAVIHGQEFSVKDFCEGIGVVVGAIGVLLAAHSIAKGENT